MTTVGTHSKPLDGAVTANGHALAPFTIGPLQVPQHGPVSVLPRHGPLDDPGQVWTAADKAGRWWHAHHAWLAAVPIVLVNAVAFAGQLAFLRGHLPWPLPGQALVAVTLESVAVYLAWQAHLALAADDSALRLRLAAYGFAAVIGALNYSHFMALHWRPTVAAVTFGMMSLTSPWLWSVHSRRVSRDALKARGLIEAHAVRLGATRWLWHPARSARVMWHATWQGENDPVKAIALVVPGAPAVTPAVTHDKAGDRAPVRRRPEVSGDGGKLSKIDRARAVLRDNPGLSNREVAARVAAEMGTCDVRTVKRARNGTAKTPLAQNLKDL